MSDFEFVEDSRLNPTSSHVGGAIFQALVKIGLAKDEDQAKIIWIGTALIMMTLTTVLLLVFLDKRQQENKRASIINETARELISQNRFSNSEFQKELNAKLNK